MSKKYREYPNMIHIGPGTWPFNLADKNSVLGKTYLKWYRFYHTTFYRLNPTHDEDVETYNLATDYSIHMPKPIDKETWIRDKAKISTGKEMYTLVKKAMKEVGYPAMKFGGYVTKYEVNGLDRNGEKEIKEYLPKNGTGPAVWQVCKDLGINGGSGNSHQCQIIGIRDFWPKEAWNLVIFKK